MSLLRLVATLLLGLALLFAGGDAVAQGKKPDTKSDSQKAEAARLKSAADVLMDQDRYADAVVLYQRAYELSSDPALLYNQGRAFEALGDYPTAVEKLELFERTAPASMRAGLRGVHELIVDLRGRIATLVVRTNAPNARLLVRQKDEGIVNFEKRLSTRAGPASIEVHAEGYESFRRDLDISAGTSLVVDAQLQPKNRDALVVVRTAPSADIFLDGKQLGRAPLQVRAAPGSHELIARASGYEEEKVAMTLAHDDRRDIDLEMRSTQGIASKWWFWTGLAVVLAGGAATAIALTTEKPHSSGSFSPGSVAGP